jgi:hypothetical protein
MAALVSVIRVWKEEPSASRDFCYYETMETRLHCNGNLKSGFGGRGPRQASTCSFGTGRD